DRIENLQRNRIDAVGRNDVVRKRRPRAAALRVTGGGQGIVDDERRLLVRVAPAEVARRSAAVGTLVVVGNGTRSREPSNGLMKKVLFRTMGPVTVTPY